jgi:hypothetical protein
MFGKICVQALGNIVPVLRVCRSVLWRTAAGLMQALTGFWNAEVRALLQRPYCMYVKWYAFVAV